jgi:hypothetical protein
MSEFLKEQVQEEVRKNIQMRMSTNESWTDSFAMGFTALKTKIHQPQMQLFGTEFGIPVWLYDTLTTLRTTAALGVPLVIAIPIIGVIAHKIISSLRRAKRDRELVLRHPELIELDAAVRHFSVNYTYMSDAECLKNFRSIIGRLAKLSKDIHDDTGVDAATKKLILSSIADVYKHLKKAEINGKAELNMELKDKGAT